MAENELLIKINADAKNAQKAFDNVKDQTEDLEGKLASVAKVSAVAFAALTAEVAFSVKAFAESEAATRQLSNALQNQGIFTEDLVATYKDYAAAVQEATGLDDDAIVKAQALAQGFLGQTKVTKELSFAIADLAELKGMDLNQAATVLAKTIGTGTNALAREGLVLSATATEAEKYAKVLEFVNTRAGGLATAANQGLGGLRGLQSAFGDLQEAIGARFAPVISKGISGLTTLFKWLSQHEIVADLAAAVIVGAGAVAALGMAIPAVVTAFTTLKAAMIAFGLATNVAFVGLPLLIGGIIAGITLLALNWNASLNVMRASTMAFGTFMGQFFGGFAKIIAGAFTLDASKINEGFEQVKSSFGKAAEEYKAIRADQVKTDEVAAQQQDAKKKEAADRIAAIESANTARLADIKENEIEILRLKTENGSQAQIELKQKENEILKAMGENRNAEELALLNDQREQVIAQQNAQLEEDLARKNEFAAIMAENETMISDQKRAALEASLMTEKDAERAVAEERIKNQIDSNNRRLMETKKYGAAYAAINQFMHSEEAKGFKSATADMTEMTRSKNATLKGIGKAASIAQIAMKTAEAAMNIYSGFSTIPIIGPALGVAGAAAAIAFGAEQISTVTAAKDGALVPGFGAGDKVPFMLEPGELVVPKRNFEEVVQGVQTVRGSGDPTTGFALTEVSLGFKLDSFIEIVEAKIIERQNLSIAILGAT